MTRTGQSIGWLSCLLILTISIPPTWPNRVKPMNLERIIESAATIFEGKCVDIKTGRDPESNMIATWYTFQVTGGIKGKIGDTFVLKQYGGQDGDVIVNSPAVSYQLGEEVVLFLYGTSELGFTSAVGLQQGKFVVREFPETKTRYVTNGMPAMILFENMEQQIHPINAAGIKAQGHERLKSERLELREFLTEVKRLVQQEQEREEK